MEDLEEASTSSKKETVKRKGEDFPSTSKCPRCRVVNEAARATTGGFISCAGEGEMDPMHNPLILTKIFTRCPPEVLANCRLVCKQWRDLSLTAWRESCRLIFRSEYSYRWEARQTCHLPERADSDPQNDNGDNPSHKFLEFVEDPENDCMAKPFRQFHLKGLNFRDDDKLMERFWNLVGAGITTLELTDCTFADVKEFRNVIYSCCPILKHLIFNTPFDYKSPSSTFTSIRELREYKDPVYREHVHLKSISFDKEFPSLNFHVSWLELLSHFPFLTSIKLRNATHVCIEDIKVFLSAVKIIREHDPRKLLLKQFDVQPHGVCYGGKDDEVSRSVFDLLRQLNIFLQSVRICFNNWDTVNIQDVIEFHGKTLKKIEARGYSLSCRLLNFPFAVQLDNLQELTIYRVSCETMSFLKYMPNLEKLHIGGEYEVKRYNTETASVSNTSKAELANVKLLKLTDFRLDYVVTEDDLKHLICWLPNVDTLAMVLNDKQLSIVCQHWRSLKKLEVFGKLLTDEGLTGMSTPGEDDIMEGIQSQPNIALLQNLREFICGSKNLTDASVYKGFLKLQCALHITLPPNHMISLDAESALGRMGTVITIPRCRSPISPHYY